MTELVVKNVVKKSNTLPKVLYTSVVAPLKKTKKNKKDPLIFDMNDFCPELNSLSMLDASLVIEMLDHYENNESVKDNSFDLGISSAELNKEISKVSVVSNNSKELGKEVAKEITNKTDEKASKKVKDKCVEELECKSDENGDNIVDAKAKEIIVGNNQHKRNYSFVGSNHKNKHRVKAINVNDSTFEIYNSLYKCQNDLGINAGIIKMCCEGLNNVKSGISKKTNLKYRFEYTNLPATKMIQRVKKCDKEDNIAKKVELVEIDPKNYIKIFKSKFFDEVGDNKNISKIMNDIFNEITADLMASVVNKFRFDMQRPIEKKKFDIDVDIIDIGVQNKLKN